VIDTIRLDLTGRVITSKPRAFLSHPAMIHGMAALALLACIGWIVIKLWLLAFFIILAMFGAVCCSLILVLDALRARRK